MRSAQPLCFIATTFFYCISAASAAELKVQIDELAELPAVQQAELIKQMKEKSLLDKNDTVVNASKKAADKSVGTAVLVTLGPIACKLIAATKRDDDLKGCLAQKDETKQASCKKAVEDRFSTVDTVCSLIKLF